ncbi:expressed unknown protein [Seminavis robusta]|uniref:Uncharacterized protein n=1 Tax=Seminavis robusta TaxID=568900 RepID=A0A9N8DP34_9STRA|nr:expressed unknown protein [Seminavis robusta]|eukprot:Sro162_g072930.1 n/a (88) ;mRNA; r:72613-72876
MDDLYIGDISMSQYSDDSECSAFSSGLSFEMSFKIMKEYENGRLHVQVIGPTGESYTFPKAEFCSMVEPEHLGLPECYDSMVLVPTS